LSAQDIYRYGVANTRFTYTTKIRPHARRMLQRLKQNYELHICTFGNRPYAHKVCHDL
jgi:TFIIF-interacting CTD phosphatase-like protein